MLSALPVGVASLDALCLRAKSANPVLHVAVNGPSQEVCSPEQTIVTGFQRRALEGLRAGAIAASFEIIRRVSLRRPCL